MGKGTMTEKLTIEQKVGYLEVELARAKAETAKLRKALGEHSHYAKIIDRAYEDGLLMIFWRSIGIRPSRRFAAMYKISQVRWEHALALLRLARLITGKGRWQLTDTATMERRLLNARDKALEDRNIFFLRHTRHQ
jgi:hypothetical protein